MEHLMEHNWGWKWTIAGALIFFGGPTDPLISPFPDTLEFSLGIYNAAHGYYSDTQYAEQSDINAFNFSSMDAMTAFCKTNNLLRTWTGLYIAGVSEQWLANFNWTGPQIKQACANWLAAVAARTNGEIGYINYANESILHHDANATGPDGAFSQAFGAGGATGYDWLIAVGKMVRQYFPAARIGVNDFNFESTANDLPYGAPTQLPQALAAIKILHDAGVLDWVGMEGYSLESVASQNLTDAINAVGALGVKVIFTEFSPDAYAGPGVDPNKVSADWQRLFPLLYSNPNVEGVIGPWDVRWSQTQNGGVAGSQFFIDDRAAPPIVEPVVAWLKSVIGVAIGTAPTPMRPQNLHIIL